MTPPPTDATVDDPLRAWSGRPLGAGRGAFSARFGLDVQPLVAWEVRDGGAPERRPVLGAVGGGEFGGIIGLGGRVSLAVDIPVFAVVRGQAVGEVAPQGGPALGDLRVHAPITLVGTQESAAALGVVPWVSAPTGAAGRLLGHAGFGAGALVAATGRAGVFSAFATAGFEARETVRWEHLTAGPRVLGAAGVGVAPVDGVSVRAELTGARELADLRLETRPEETALAGTPIEAVLGLRARASERVVLGLAGQTALTSGVGAARARVHATVAIALGRSTAASPSTQADAPASLRVTDPAGLPLPGARVLADGEPVGRTDLEGIVALPRGRDRRQLQVLARGYEPLAVPSVARGGATVALRPTPIPVEVRIADQQGGVVDAVVTLLGPVTADGAPSERPVALDGQGRATIAVEPGVWRVRVQAPDLAPQERELRLRPGDAADQVEVLLAPSAGEGALVLVVRDPQGREVGGASVTVDGASVGTTSSGGVLRLDALGGRPRTLAVRADNFLVATRAAVTPTVDGAPVELVLAPEPGSVELVVTSPEGPVDDATARWLGPSRLSFDVGPGGRRTFVLRPGAWTLLVGSPTWGLQQRLVQVDDEVAELQRIEVVLQPPERGGATLALRIVDVDGLPVQGAQVVLDGRTFGRTGSGGGLEVADLNPGPRQVRVAAERMRPIVAPVEVQAPLTERTLVARFEPGATRVRARSPRAAVSDATARFAGPSPVDPLPLGPAGEATAALDAGGWSVLVASPEHGLQQRSLVIEEDDPREHLVDVVFGPPAGVGGALRVVARDPEGGPVAGAAVALGDAPLGRTGRDGALRAEGLPAGSHRVRVSASGFVSADASVRLSGGEVERAVALRWGPGATRVTVTDADGQPVPDAMLRFAGPRFVPPIPVASSGASTVALDPGSWLVVVASPAAGLAQRAFEVPETPGLTQLSVTLAPPSADRARLLVRVEDPDGRPIRGASVTVGDQVSPLGDLSAGVLDVPAGPASIRATAPGFRPVDLGRVALRPGDQERVIPLAFEPVPLIVRVVGPDGAPVAASIRADGPADVASVAADPSTGEAALALRPGAWTITAEAPELGAAAARVSLVPAQSGARATLALRRAEVELVGGTLRLRQVVRFEFGSDRLGADAGPLLDELAAALLAHPELRRVRVEGHTDAVGRIALNQALSQRRAEAVRTALVARGVAPERLIAVGYGPTRPLVPGDSDEARAANRRVALSVVESEPPR